MESGKNIDKKLINTFFFSLLLLFMYLGFQIFYPFWSIIAFSVLITVAAFPIHRFVSRKIKSDSTASLITTIIVFLFVLIPAAFFAVVLINQLIDLVPVISKFITETKNIESYIQNLPYVGNLYEKGRAALEAAGVNLDVTSLGQKYGGTVANYLLGKGQSLLANLGGSLFALFFILMTIFFLFRDGKSYYKTFYDIIPMADRDKEFLFEKSYNAIKAIFLGTILTAFVQGALAFVAYFVAGVHFSLFWGFATFITSFLPLGGSAIIWIPIAIYLFASKSVIWGIAMVIWGTVVISGSDNVVRPLIIGGQTNINTLVLVFAILGGLEVFGFIGIFITPVIIVLLDNLLLIYKEKYLNFNIFNNAPSVVEDPENSF